jgi:hypothetical protein
MKVKKIKGVRLPECNETPMPNELFKAFKSAYDDAGLEGHPPLKRVQPSRPRQ